MSAFDWIGLDFGGQKADTTVISYCDSGIAYFQSNTKEDTDTWILNWLNDHREIKYVFIDAPLSLPAAYYKKGNDFMFRKADRKVNAMSPMFLGGLTARAIQLKQQLIKSEVKLVETYPAQLELVLFGSKSPKKRNWDPGRIEQLQIMLGIDVSEPENRHQYDALLAWVSAWRHRQGDALEFGDPDEGVIYV